MSNKKSTRISTQSHMASFASCKRSTRPLAFDFSNILLQKPKRSQTGDTLAWLVATIIIVIILAVFVFVSHLMSKGGEFSNSVMSLFSGDSDGEGVDWIKEKSSFALEENSNNKESIEGWINDR